MKKVAILTLLMLMVGGHKVAANELGVREYTGMGGWVLPDQVPGLDEMLPTWGVKYGFGVNNNGMVQLGYFNALAKGVSSHVLDVEYRYSSFNDGVGGYISAGAGAMHYKSSLLNKSRQEVNALIGTGFLFQVSSEVWFQSDMKFRVDPGVQLMLMFGLAMRL
jgi:hypothetical protein